MASIPDEVNSVGDIEYLSYLKRAVEVTVANFH